MFPFESTYPSRLAAYLAATLSYWYYQKAPVHGWKLSFLSVGQPTYRLSGFFLTDESIFTP